MLIAWLKASKGSDWKDSLKQNTEEHKQNKMKGERRVSNKCYVVVFKTQDQKVTLSSDNQLGDILYVIMLIYDVIIWL